MVLVPVPNVTEPSPGSAAVWRYMPMWKFLSILDTGTLWFARSDKYPDRWEGVASALSYDVIATQLPAKLRANIAAQGKLHHLNALGMGTDEDIARITQQLKEAIYRSRRFLLVTCWNQMEHELEALWRVYTQGTDLSAAPERFQGQTGAVAIRSDVASLAAAFDASSYPIAWGTVEYIDHAVTRLPFTDLRLLSFRKRRAFTADHEVRGLIHYGPPNGALTSPWFERLREQRGDPAAAFGRVGYHTVKGDLFVNEDYFAAFDAEVRAGMPVPVDLEAVIKAVRLEPGATEDLRDRVVGALRDHGLSGVSVQTSELDTEPPR